MPQALPGVSVSTPPAPSRGNGLLRLVSPAELDAQDQQRAADAAEARRPTIATPELSAYIRTRWEVCRNHRNSSLDPLSERLLRAQRMFNGEYDPAKLAQIERFGGSKVYSRLAAVKARGATSLLRDVYLSADRPWAIEPEPDPPVPPEVRANIMQLIATEVQTLQQAGQPVLQDQAHMRYVGLMHAAQQAARRNAMTQADAAANKVDDLLVQGKFYDALAEFLTDLPLFPFAVLKGPVVRMVPRVQWTNGQPVQKNTPTMFWERVSPFDVYWTPGVSNIEDAEIIERRRLTRSDLNDLLGLPGYNQAAVRAALNDYASGLRDWLDAPDTEQAINEGRENPTLNQSNMIDALEYHGNIQGKMLLEQGVDKKQVPDPDRDYAVQAWVVGRHVLKTQLNPSPRQRHPYYVTSFEKVPGTIAGHGVPDILEDLQEVANATLRAMVNNLAIASGPQVVIDDEALAPTADGDELYPWKRWRVARDPGMGGREPITFFQPASNAQELITIYQQIVAIADDNSAIPRYVTGNSPGGGAGRTASGLSMLMGNAAKVLQTVVANIDIDVMHPALSGLYDMIMLTDQSGMLTGEEHVRVRGVKAAVQQETEHQKQLQFLQLTGNPIDMQVIGPIGRARVLRAIAQGLGLPDDVVPDDQTLQAQMDAQKQMMQASQAMIGAAGHNPHQQGAQGPDAAASGKAGAPASPAAATAGNQPPHPTPARLADHAPPVNAFQQGAPMP